MKATYDTNAKLVILDQIAPVSGIVFLDVQKDLYSDAKVQWLNDSNLNKFVFPYLAIGGQTLSGGAIAPRIYFLKSPWQIRPYEADHDLTLSKNLFSESGDPLFIPTLGNFTVYSNTVNDFGSGDDRLQRILDLLEADEEFTPTLAKKLVKGTTTVLLQKNVTGGSLTGPITLKE